MPVPIIDTDQIVITASRAPESEARTPASVTIIDHQRIVRLDEPLISALLRLTPSAAVATSGPAGSLTEIRIRGAEANHTLLFVDGIKIDDPASGDTPRFEILNADLASRIEVVRGPAIRAVGLRSRRRRDRSQRYRRRSGRERESRGRLVRPCSERVLQAQWSAAAPAPPAPWVSSAQPASTASPGRATRTAIAISRAGCAGRGARAADVEIGASALGLSGRSEFDGFDFLTGAHADTLDSSRNRLAAGRIWATVGSGTSPWRAQVAGTLLGSSNRNYLADVQQNRTRGARRNLSAQLEHRFATGAVTHRLIVAGETERESFHARDTAFGGFTNQDRTRRHELITAEWRGDVGWIAGDVAVRRDLFNRFRDATSVRASLLGQIGGGFSLAGSYAQGIAQPTFFDLYGFFPGNFVGNPDLKPESSRGFELSLRYRRGPFGASLTGYRQRLRDEIVNNATFTSVLNAPGSSRRSGIEATVDWKLGDQLRLSANYSYLKATQPDAATGKRLTETRRPEHSGSIALDGASGRFSYGASLAFVGRHLDNRDTFPFARVTLGSYWLADARVAYAIRPGIELFAARLEPPRPALSGRLQLPHRGPRASMQACG